MEGEEKRLLSSIGGLEKGGRGGEGAGVATAREAERWVERFVDFVLKVRLDLDQAKESTESDGRPDARNRVRRSSRDGVVGVQKGGGETLTLGRERDAFQFKLE